MDVHTANTVLERIVNSPWTLVALSWLGAGLLMWLGAHLAGLGYVTFGRSLLAAVAASTVTWITTELFPAVTLLGVSLGIVLGLLLTWLVIKEVFNTSFGKAFLAWVFRAGLINAVRQEGRARRPAPTFGFGRGGAPSPPS